MKITEFITHLKESYVELYTSDKFVNTEGISKIVSAELSLMSLDLNIAFLERGKIIVDDHFDIFANGMFNTTQTTNKKLFYNGKPLIKELVLHTDSKIATRFVEDNAALYDSVTSDKIPGLVKIKIDLSFINFDEFKEFDCNLNNIADLYLKYTKHKAFQKVVNFFNSKQKVDKYTTLSNNYKPEIIEYLKSIGINDDGYRSNYKSDNVYNSPIDLSVAGFSNLPSVNDVLTRIKANKSQTTAGKVMEESILLYESATDKKKLEEQSLCIINALRNSIFSYILNNKLNPNSLDVKKDIYNIEGFEIIIETKI